MSIATEEQRKSWPKPNYEDPDSLHGLIVGVTVPALVLAVIFIAVRFYGKGLLRQTLWKDDWIMLAAMLLALPISIFTLVGTKLGLGTHIWDLRPEWYTPYWKIGYAAELLFPTACGLTKISLCMTYIRLFPGRVEKIFTYTLMSFVGSYTVVSIFLSLFQCRPIRSYWDQDVEQTCINMRVALLAMAALNSFSDFLIYLYPMKPLWNLRLPVTQKLGLIFVFSIGLVVCIAGVMRMYYINVFFDSYDTHWNGASVWVTMVLEMNVGIICGCLSGVKPVFAALFPGLFGPSHRTRSRRNGPTYGTHTTRSKIAESFAFQSLPDASHTKTVDPEFSVEAIQDPVYKKQRNFAWASSDGNMDTRLRIPENAIVINHAVSVEEGEMSPTTPRSEAPKKLSDAGSEEWIMDDVARAL